MTIRFGVLTISDRCARGEAADASGPAVAKLVREKGWRVTEMCCVPDEEKIIIEKLREWCDAGKIDVALTTGGTGLGPRDVTPEATKKLIEKELPGFGELMRSEGLKKTSRAVLSRSTAGSYKKSLIINLPGSREGAVESLTAVIDIISHALEMISGSSHDKNTAGKAA
ncbi:MAG: MogA/MoaB family molybdenum cofactor biosynthesis protein [bacterium]